MARQGVNPRNPGEKVQIPTASAVEVTRVNPLVWRQALDAADGDATRIQVHDECSVTVHNNGRWR